jgi:hypothetical protein
VLLLECSRRKPREIGCVSMRFTERSSEFSQYTYTLFCDRSPNDFDDSPCGHHTGVYSYILIEAYLT